MANSLKIVNQDAGATINEAGYISVVNNIVFDPDGLDEFRGEEGDDGFTKRRTKLLCNVANNAGGSGGILKQLDSDDNPQEVKPRNCRIRAQPDTRAMTHTGFNKVTISLPESALVESDLDYVDDYIEKFLSIRSGAALPAATNGAAALKARKFMFGVMMLTKCR